MTYSNRLKSTALISIFLLSSLLIAHRITANPFNSISGQTALFQLDCEEIEVTLDITHTTDNQNDGKIVMKFKKSTTSYTCFVFSGANQDNRLDVKDNTISDLARGDYNLYIQDKNGCTKHVKFKIN